MSKMILICSCMLLALGVIFGGATDIGLLQTTVLELFALFLLAAMCFRRSQAGSEGLAVQWYIIAFWLVPIMFISIQIIPLPSSIWSSLPGRTVITEVYALVGMPLSWFTISLTPQSTRLLIFGLLPAATMFFLLLELNGEQRRSIVFFAIFLGLVSDFLGLLQLSQGVSSSLRLYHDTNLRQPVGFFANANHHAALLYSTTVFAISALAYMIKLPFLSSTRSKSESPGFITVTLLAMTCVTLIASQMLTRSRMGNALMLVAMAISLISSSAVREKRTEGRQWIVFALIVVIGLTLTVTFGFSQFVDRFDSNLQAESRWEFLRNTYKAAMDYLPFGSGLGSFDRIYHLVETAESLNPSFINHAHNDYAELFLEAGFFGVIWVLAFILWWLRQSIRIWRRSAKFIRFNSEQDWLWARAGTTIVGLLLCHSLVDYPLRTVTISLYFALAAGLMMESRAQNAPDKPGGPHIANQ